jgi:methylated-DNA-[protein]-cysteine S-methyltransferase
MSVGQQPVTRLAVPTPIGAVVLEGTDAALHSVWLPTRPAPVLPSAGKPSEAVLEARRQLEEYFAGQRTAFTVPLEARGTPFQREVWEALASIPYGATASYADIARMVGRPRAFRAVGQANGANPLAIIVPCHRVIAASGGIGGYSGGLPIKRWLLALEVDGAPPDSI